MMVASAMFDMDEHPTRPLKSLIPEVTTDISYPSKHHIMTTTSLLPMWRSPTASSTSSRRSGLRQEVSWEDDEADLAFPSCGLVARSPARTVQCLNFLSQIERVHIYESPHKRLRGPVFVLDVYLVDEDDYGEDLMGQPTYQIERTLSEFEELRDQTTYWTSLCHLHQYTTTLIGQAKSTKTTDCSCCATFQTRRAAWEGHWPGRVLSRLFQSKSKREMPLQCLMNDILELTRPKLSLDQADPCTALQQLPTLLTNFLVRHELSMED